MAAVVAVACAMTAGWMRTVGQVTPVPTRSESVAVAMPPSVLQTNGELPCVVVQGW